MYKPIFLLFLSGLFSCLNGPPQPASGTPVPDSGYVWTRLLDSAEWKKSYNFQMFSIRDTLWVMHPQGNWYSADALRWVKSDLGVSIGNLAFLDYVLLGDTLFGLGHFEGNIERFTLKKDVSKSADLRKWTLAAPGNLPERFFYHPFAFHGKLWIIGGEDKTGQYADIWNSSDGVHWVKQKDNAPFGKRSNDQVVFLKERLYLLGNDVWSSENGLDWRLETPEIVKGEQIFGYAALVFDDRIWLLGCNRNGQFSSQVLWSADGKTWQGMDAPWSPRGGIAATVHKDKIYMTGGKYGGTPDHTEFIYSNDLWALEKKGE